MGRIVTSEGEHRVVGQQRCVPSRVERYKARRKPACNGGLGCYRCWHKWHIINVRGGRDDRPRGAEGFTWQAA